jgi:hypothetical protein
MFVLREIISRSDKKYISLQRDYVEKEEKCVHSQKAYVEKWQTLPTDQEVPGSIPNPAVWFFSSGEIFYGIYVLGVSVTFVHVVICCFRRRPLHAPDPRLEEALQLCSCP